MGCHCSPSYCYGRCNNYKAGYDDGYRQARAEDAILNGTDPTMYLLVGGPLDGQHKKTGGVRHFFAPIFPERCYHMADMCNGLTTSRCGHPCCDPAIRTGTYEKTQTSKGFSVYRWKP